MDTFLCFFYSFLSISPPLFIFSRDEVVSEKEVLFWSIWCWHGRQKGRILFCEKIMGIKWNQNYVTEREREKPRTKNQTFHSLFLCAHTVSFNLWFSFFYNKPLKRICATKKAWEVEILSTIYISLWEIRRKCFFSCVQYLYSLENVN